MKPSPAQKTKNRRLGRRHVLDVKLRTQHLRRNQLLKMTWLVLVLSLSAGAVYVVRQGGIAFWNWAVAENTYFNIQQLEIRTGGVLKPEQVREWAGVRGGLNLFQLNLSRVQRDLEMIPSIAHAEVERVLPDTLRIHVREREPIARFYHADLRSAQQTRPVCFTLDREAVFMPPLDPHQCLVPQQHRVATLPVLLGMPLGDLSPGYRVESEQVQLAVRWLAAFQASPMATRVILHAIDLGDSGKLHVTTTDKTRVTFRADSLEEQLLEWLAAQNKANEWRRRMATLDLSYTNNRPMVLQPPASALQSPTRSL